MSESKHGPNDPARGRAAFSPRRKIPSPSRHAKLPGKKFRRRRKSKKTAEEAWELATQSRSRPLGWVLGGLAAVILLAGGTIAWFCLHDNHEAPKVIQTKIPQVESFDPGLAKDWEGPVPIEIAESFTRAETDEERLKWVRAPERAEPILVDFFRDGPGAKEKILGVTPMEPASNGNIVFQRFHVRMEDGGSRLLCIVLTEDGGKVDFESYARHGSATWEDLLSGKARDAAEVRVFVEPGFAFTYGFSDEKKWSSFIATTPDWNHPLYFYAVRESPADQALQDLTKGGAMRATLSIRSVEDSHQRKQFEVTEVLVGGWCR